MNKEQLRKALSTFTTGVTLITTLDINGNSHLDGTLQITGNFYAGDNDILNIGSSNDLQIYHDGSNSYIEDAGTGELKLITSAGTALTLVNGTTNVDIVGDVTAATLNADGDTAAGDNAAIGYTSAEGLILAGQGSTSDITLKNDADETVLSIPTGTQTVVIEGERYERYGLILQHMPNEYNHWVFQTFELKIYL